MSINQDDGRVVITVKDLYMELKSVTANIQVMTSRIDIMMESYHQSNEQVQRQLMDLESRMRKLEAWKYGIPVSIIGVVSTAVATIISYINN